MLLTPETRPLLYDGTRPEPRGGEARAHLDTLLARIAPSATQPLARMLALTRWCSRIPRDYPETGPSTLAGHYADFDCYRWGGSEEEVITKGSPWPQELSRVLATLLRRAGFATRLAFLYRADLPALHTVVEAWALNGWAVCDACANRCYVWPHHGYASAADLQRQPWLVDQAPEHGRSPYVNSVWYSTVAISPYPLDADRASDLPGDAYTLQPAQPEDAVALRAAVSALQG